jgi:hypothetical protein
MLRVPSESGRFGATRLRPVFGLIDQVSIAVTDLDKAISLYEETVRTGAAETVGTCGRAH